MFSNHFITNFPQNVPVKKYENQSVFWRRYGKNFAAYFLGHPVYLNGCHLLLFATFLRYDWKVAREE